MIEAFVIETSEPRERTIGFRRESDAQEWIRANKAGSCDVVPTIIYDTMEEYNKALKNHDLRQKGMEFVKLMQELDISPARAADILHNCVLELKKK